MIDARAVEEAPRRPYYYVFLVAGWGLIGYALTEMVLHASSANPPQLFILLVGLNVVNDLVVVPVTIGLALLARRLCPPWLLAPVQLGLIVTAAVLVYAAPIVGGFGRSAAAGASRLPWNYTQNVAVVLGVVWGVVVLLAVWSWRRRARSA